MRLLILGGIAEAKHIADQLHRQGVDLIYSLAGLVRTPDVDYPLALGGFTQFGGLAAYVAQQKITAIVDATHPYATTMTATVQQVTTALAIPYWRYNRPAWTEKADDDWHCFDEMGELFDGLKAKQRILLSLGQVSASLLNKLAATPHVVLRTAVKPKMMLPSNVEWLKAIGPFDYQSEKDLILQHRFDVIATKNSGGEATRAKLLVAKELAVMVAMLNRPATDFDGAQVFDDVDLLLRSIAKEVRC